MLEINQSLLSSVREITRQTGEHLKAFYARSVEITIKSDDTPVTEADLFVSRFMIEQLNRLTPNVPILSEESCDIPLEKRACWDEYWIIDPLDGTQQFINRTDQFSVVVSLVQKSRPVLGVIHAPVLAKTYFAMRGCGAFLQKNEEIRPLVGTKFAQGKTKLLITMGSTHPSDIERRLNPLFQAEFYRYGSSSLKAGLVAEGKADCYVCFGKTGEWDTATAEVLLAEAGGGIFDLNFEALTYNQRPTFMNPHFVMAGDKRADWEKIFQFN